MQLVQLLLPLTDSQGTPFPRSHYDQLATRLTDQFGGVTAYTRSPASGRWESNAGQTEQDDLVVYEVMVAQVDPGWWAALREELEALFDQDELVVRSWAMTRL